MSFLSQVDPEISHALYMEGKRQRETINLIASENYASKAVLEAEGSVLTNKPSFSRSAFGMNRRAAEFMQ